MRRWWAGERITAQAHGAADKMTNMQIYFIRRDYLVPQQTREGPLWRRVRRYCSRSL